MAKKQKAITTQHLIFTLQRVEFMVIAIRDALERMVEEPDALERKRPVQVPADTAVVLAGQNRGGCRLDGSCARIRQLTEALPKRLAKRTRKK